MPAATAIRHGDTPRRQIEGTKHGKASLANCAGAEIISAKPNAAQAPGVGFLQTFYWASGPLAASDPYCKLSRTTDDTAAQPNGGDS
jgi:hypothetical protein